MTDSLGIYQREQWIHQFISKCIDKRIDQGLTQEDMAERLDVSVKKIKKFERSTNPSIKMIYNYVHALGYSLILSMYEPPIHPQTISVTTFKDTTAK